MGPYAGRNKKGQKFEKQHRCVEKCWAEAHRREWITTADQHQVRLVAEQKDERVRIMHACRQELRDWRLARALRDPDWDIQNGVAVILIIPLGQKRAGVMVETAPRQPSMLDPMNQRHEGKIPRAEENRELPPLRELEDLVTSLLDTLTLTAY